MDKGTQTIRTIDLDHDQMLILDGGRNAHLRVLHGATWLTAEGLPEDSVLTAGASADLPARRTLITGLGPTRVQIISPRLGAAARLRSAWVRMLRSLRQRVARLQLGTPQTEPWA
jgi:hypothetical protein